MCCWDMARARWQSKLFMVLPLLVAIAFFLIADIDSPRGGVIRVASAESVEFAGWVGDRKRFVLPDGRSALGQPGSRVTS